MISGFNGLSPIGVSKQAIKDFGEDDMSTHAAALTYRLLLSIFPFLIFILTLLGALDMEEFIDSILKEARIALSADLYSQFATILTQVQSGANGGLLSFGLILAVWSAAGGVRSVMHALNVAYDVEEERSLLRKYLASIVFTIGLGVILLAAMLLMFLGPQSIEWLADQVGLDTLFVNVWTWLRFPAAIVLMVLAVALIYYFFPNVDQPFRIVSPGSLIAVIVWIIATLGVSLYLSSFGNYNATSGSLGGVIALLFYLFVSSAILLLGAEVNAVIFKADPHTDKSNVEDEKVDEAQDTARA